MRTNQSLTAQRKLTGPMSELSAKAGGVGGVSESGSK